MMCLDSSDHNNLKAATEDADNDFHHNLQTVTPPQWVCEQTERPAQCSPYSVKPCEGFKLMLSPGLAHGPDHAVCVRCNADWPSRFDRYRIFAWRNEYIPSDMGVFSVSIQKSGQSLFSAERPLQVRPSRRRPTPLHAVSLYQDGCT
jgi:hypothetical protein